MYYNYFGARYYDSDLNVWLSVDPLASKYPSLSPYMYVLGKPTALIDPNGMNTIKMDESYKDAINDIVNDNPPNQQYTLPKNSTDIDKNIWESYTPSKHSGHDQYWRNKENGSFLAFDKGKNGKDGH